MRRTGAIVHVEPQVFDLLVHLIRNCNRIVTKDELFDAIWQGRIVSEATLSSRISAARRALGDSGNDQSFIRTLHKRGFRFVGDVNSDGAAPAPIVIETSVPLQGAALDTARLVPAGETLPLPGEFPSAALSFQDTDRDPDPGYVADAAAVAVAAPPALAERVADAAAAAMAPDERATAAAAEEKETASDGRLAARKLLVAV